MTNFKHQEVARFFETRDFNYRPPPPVDIYRDTYVRYMGYANELGEAFRPNFPKMVLPSYGVSFTYVFLISSDLKNNTD